TSPVGCMVKVELGSAMGESLHGPAQLLPANLAPGRILIIALATRGIAGAASSPGPRRQRDLTLERSTGRSSDESQIGRRSRSQIGASAGDRFLCCDGGGFRCATAESTAECA